MTSNCHRFYIGYTLPGESCESAVPVLFGKSYDGSACWMLGDGAYDAYDYFYNEDDYDGDDLKDNAPYLQFERALCEVIAPKLDSMIFGDSVSYTVCGIPFTFSKLDDHN